MNEGLEWFYNQLNTIEKYMLWHSKSRDEIFSELDTSEEGLPQEEAEERLEKEGENRIESGDSTSPLKIFISQFQDNLIYLLMAAALLSVGIGLLPGHQPEYAEAGIIMLILFANGTFGFIQDYRAEKSIEALKKMSTPAAMVMRDGEKVEVDSTEIVPGDIIFLEQGDAVPADARLLGAESLDTDESALTGESNNVSKDPGKVEEESAVADRSNMVFMDTHVVRGRGKAVVTDTGMDTEVGDIAEEISDADDKETPFQEEVDEMGRKIGALVIGIVALVAVIQLSITGAGMITVLLMAIGLSVAAIPESLPAIVTLTLALGSKKLLKKNALVRRLPVVEALGSVNYIVTDKTGTLTEGVMTVENLYYQGENFEVTGTGTSTEGKFMKDGEEVDTEYLGPILECGVYCNNAEKTGEKSDKDFRGEPTEIALLVSGMKAGLKPDKERKRSIPFSSDRKRMTTVTEDGKAYMKGAPETVLERCDRILIDGEEKELTDQKKDEIIDQNHEYAREALRVLGFAHKEVEGDEDDEEVESGMVFLGLQGMMDPAREEVKDAVEDCRTAGIGVVMATGDNIETAKAIGKELGFNPEGALTGPEIDEMSDKELEEKVTEVEIFARVTPQHKVRISKALQSQDYNVAMTGDGVNDAPALKNSDVGIAMGQRGTDVAKKSSDMVLQDDNFVTIRDAISEGRAIFDNIRKVTNQLLSTNSGEVMFVFLGTLIGGLFYPEQFAGADAVVLTAVMILWVNFASDGPPAIALGEDPKVKGIMERNPRDPDESIIDKKILYMIAVTGPLASIIMLPLFFMNIENMMLAQTILFMALAFFELLMFQVIRRDYGLKLWDNKYLIAAILASTLLHLSIIYTPIADYFGVVQLGLQHWGYIAASLLVFWVIEVGFRRLLSRRYGNRINELGK
jgi:Ca2+-transporting ATPase